MAKLTRLAARGLKLSDFVQRLTGRDLLVGPTGAGKTSRLDALALALLGYHPSKEVPKRASGILEKLGRPGADRVEVVLEVDPGGDSEAARIERRFAGGKQTVKVNGVKMKSVGAGDERVRQLAGDQLAVLDGGSFLYGTGQERRRWFLDNLVRDEDLPDLAGLAAELGRQPLGGRMEQLLVLRETADERLEEARAELRAAEAGQRGADERLKLLPDGGAPAAKLAERLAELRGRLAGLERLQTRLDTFAEAREQVEGAEERLERAETALAAHEKMLAEAGPAPSEDLWRRTRDAQTEELRLRGLVEADEARRRVRDQLQTRRDVAAEEVEKLELELADDELELPGDDAEAALRALEGEVADAEARWAQVAAVLTFLNSELEGTWYAAFREAGYADERWDAVEAVRQGLHKRYADEQRNLTGRQIALEKRRGALERRQGQLRGLEDRRAVLADLDRQLEAAALDEEAAKETSKLHLEKRYEFQGLERANEAAEGWREAKRLRDGAGLEEAAARSALAALREALEDAPEEAPDDVTAGIADLEEQIARAETNRAEAIAHAAASDELAAAERRLLGRREAFERASARAEKLASVERGALEALGDRLPAVPRVGRLRIEFEGDQARLYAGQVAFATLSGGQRVAALAQLASEMTRPPLRVVCIEAGELDRPTTTLLLKELGVRQLDNVIVCRHGRPDEVPDEWTVHEVEMPEVDLARMLPPPPRGGEAAEGALRAEDTPEEWPDESETTGSARAEAARDAEGGAA